jgi:hypothetical protein
MNNNDEKANPPKGGDAKPKGLNNFVRQPVTEFYVIISSLIIQPDEYRITS